MEKSIKIIKKVNYLLNNIFSIPNYSISLQPYMKKSQPYSIQDKYYSDKQLKSLSDKLKKAKGNRHILVKCHGKNSIKDVLYLDEIYD